MNKILKSNQPAVDTPDQPGFNLGKWVGRREAFGLMAGRCSAAEIETVKRIRDEKLYLSHGCSWEDFCPKHLHASRRGVERELGYLQRFGPVFFLVRQLTHINVKEYESIAAQISEDGVNLDGAVIALRGENTEQLMSAVKELVKRAGCVEDKPAAAPRFDVLLKRCQVVAEMLESIEDNLNEEQRLHLANAVSDIQAAATWLGAGRSDIVVPLPTRRL